jgi:hypothetical protein
VLGLSKIVGLILASISEGGRSLASAILATTGRWSDLAQLVNIVGEVVMLRHLHSES